MANPTPPLTTTPTPTVTSTVSPTVPDYAQQAIEKMVKINPQLVNDPATVQSIANRYGLRSEQVVQTMTYQQHKDVVNRGLLRNTWHSLQDWFNKNAVQSVQNPNYKRLPNTAVGTVKGLAKGVSELPAAVPVLASTAWNAVTNPYGQTNGQSNWKSPIEMLVMAPRTLAAATGTEVKQNGWGYAIGHLAPALLGGKGISMGARALFGTKLTAAEMAAAKEAAQVAADQATVDGAVGGMSFEQQAAAADAAARLRVSDPVGRLRNQERIIQKNYAFTPDAAAKLKAVQAKIAEIEKDAYDVKFGARDRFAEPTKFNKSIDAARRIGENYLSGAIRLPVEGLRAFNRVLGSGTWNAAALIRMPGIQSDPHVWEAALHGEIIDSDGRKHTIGDVISNALAGPGFFQDIIAKVLDFDTAFVVDDPFVKGFKLIGQAKSAAGFTGYLSKFFGGMGVSHAGDFARAFAQYPSVRVAVRYMAEHNAAEINNTFRNVFNAKILLKLEKAKTTDQVISVLEDAVAAGEFVGSTAPRMGWYTTFKTALTGELGKRFGTLGGLLRSEVEVDRALRDKLLAENGYDIRPKNYIYQRLTPAGKAGVLFRQRLRAQFLRTPEHMDRVMGKNTNRIITPGSVDAVNSIADMMRAAYQPDTVVNGVSEILIHSASDPNAYRRAYRQAMYDLFNRPLESGMARSEYETVRNAISDHVWEHVNRLTGNDGGGITGRYVASKDAWRDILDTPMGEMRAGIGNTHLGRLVLPSARTVKQIQRKILETALQMDSYASKKALLSTEATLKDLKELANFSEKNIDQVISGLEKTLEEKRLSVKDLWETKELYKGYNAKYRSLLKKYAVWLTEDAMKGLTRAEKIALVFKDVADQTRKVTEHFNRLSDEVTARLGVVPPGFEAAAEDLTAFAESLGMSEDALIKAMDTLRGEQQAVEDMLAHLNATFGESFDSLNEVMEIAKQVAVATLDSAEARAKFLKSFKANWERTADSVPGKNRFTAAVGKTFFGKRGLRNNREMLIDLEQAYLNKYFKPMALSSPGWAMRVSTSEIMLNSFRIGGMNFFESHLAASIAKHEFRLAGSMKELEALGKPEKLMLRNVVAGLMLGIERGAIGAMSDPQKARLVGDAVDAMLDHNGHLRMNMEGHNDAVTSENMENFVESQVHGLDKEGKPEVSTVFRTEGHTIIQANDASAGTALHENINRAYNDEILHEGALFLHGEAKATGTALFAANEDALMKRINEEAVRRIEGKTTKVGRKSAQVWEDRNRLLDDLRQELMASSEFRNVNEAEKKILLDLVASKAKSVDDVIAENVPKYMKGAYDRANLSIATTENSIARIEAQIAEQSKIVAQYEDDFRLSLLDPETPMYTKSLGEKLDEADARLRELGRTRETLDKQIIEHPFRQYYTSLESGAALAPYKPILNDLRQQLTEKVATVQRDTESRIRELFGETNKKRSAFASLTFVV
jgi:hypothetical protein